MLHLSNNTEPIANDKDLHYKSKYLTGSVQVKKNHPVLDINR